jgi:hypothetical protein
LEIIATQFAAKVESVLARLSWYGKTMPSPRRTKPDRSRALELLAASRDGCTEAIMVIPEMMVAIIRDGLGTASAERVVAGEKSVEIAREDHGCGQAGGPTIRPR